MSVAIDGCVNQKQDQSISEFTAQNFRNVKLKLIEFHIMQTRNPHFVMDTRMDRHMDGRSDQTPRLLSHSATQVKYDEEIKNEILSSLITAGCLLRQQAHT